MYKRNLNVASPKFWLHFLCIGSIQLRKQKIIHSLSKMRKQQVNILLLGQTEKGTIESVNFCKSNCTLDKESGFTHFGLSQKPLKAVSLRSHCAKVQKYKRAKQVSNFLICGANDVLEHYGKRFEILHGCPFEG